MVVCPSCNTRYADNALRFCGRCGSDLGRTLQNPMPSDEQEKQRRDPFVGKIVDGRYHVLARIGQGGMGSVYKVVHLAMGKMAAMKVLHPSLTPDREMAQRFRREAEAVSKLSSPNTVQVFDFGEAEGSMYLVMELIKGEDLGAILRRDGPLPVARLLPMIMQVCDALSEAHELGIVHRDLKPENVLVSRARDGRDFVKVLDFGLAKLRDQEELNQVTARGSLIGTPFYMSPEQIRAETLDARSDIYSMGALMYRLVTGAHPHEAPTPVAVLTQHLTEEIVPPSMKMPKLQIPPRVDALVAKAMAKRPEDRYASADELRAAIADMLAAPSQQLAQISPNEPDQRRASDHKEPSAVTPVGAAQPLRREDFDAYERGLKRRRWIGVSILPLGLVLGVAAFVVFTRMDPELEVRDYEHEPNNTPRQANAVASGRPVKGQIGKRIAVEESDRDFFRLLVKGNEPAVLRAQLSGIPNMELVLEVFDAGGRKEAESDNGSVGDGEVIPNLRVAPGEHYVSVREAWTQGRPATENVSDYYTLTPTWKPIPPNLETEPDNSVADALPIKLGEPMHGYLGQADDVDYYFVRGAAGGAIAGEVTGVPGVDVRLVVLPPASTSGPPGPLPPGAQVFDSGGYGAGEQFDKIPVTDDGPGPIVVVERKLALRKGQLTEHQAIPSVDTEYTLRLRRTP